MIPAAPRIGVEAAEATLARMLWSRVERSGGRPAQMSDFFGRRDHRSHLSDLHARADAELSEEAGEVTPTQELKRRRIGEKYADVLESLYESRPEHDAT